jgi:hypothetical protein
MAELADPDAGTEERLHEVSILVNDQVVKVPGPRATGLEIKESAIRQGLPIDLGFQLIEELPHDRTRVVGDSDVVEVRNDSRFLALAPDDNS